MISKPEPIIPLENSPREDVIEVMIRAYSNDPMVNYIIPDGRLKRRRLLWYWGTALHSGLLYSKVYTTRDVNGIAIWSTPESSKLTLWEMFRAGMLLAPFKLGIKASFLLKSAMDYTKKIENETSPGNHWHLIILAVDPPQQGKGLGGMLILPMLEQADEGGHSCYLETFNKRAIPFYEKQNFKPIIKAEIPNGGPCFWGMLREPLS